MFVLQKCSSAGAMLRANKFVDGQPGLKALASVLQRFSGTFCFPKRISSWTSSLVSRLRRLCCKVAPVQESFPVQVISWTSSLVSRLGRLCCKGLCGTGAIFRASKLVDIQLGIKDWARDYKAHKNCIPRLAYKDF